MTSLEELFTKDEAIVGTRFETIGAFFTVIINTMIGIGISIAVISIIYAGIKFITTRTNDPREVDTAKKALNYALIALVLTLFAVVIKNLVLNLVGAQNPYLINDTIGL